MGEYIKREDAISAVCSGCNLEFSERHCEPPDCEIRHAINAVPTADVVSVVRCKDCTEWDEKEQECSHWYGFRENGFCSYGKRKGGDE